MPIALKRFFIALIFLIAGACPFYFYLTEGLSFYTFHAITGLMALKHQIAQCFLNGEYPLWNPMLICGVPFHTGIGILDPFLLSYLFLEKINALIFSAYLGFVTAGLSMYLYLRKVWQLDAAPSLVGGGFYLFNPFFGATCHESVFMMPAVFVPLVFLFFEHAKNRRSFFNASLTGLFLAFSFFTGNLESYYFVAVFFLIVQGVRTAFVERISKSWADIFSELFLIFYAALFSFCIAAVDLLPSIEMLFYSDRSASSLIYQNLIFFSLTAAMSIGCLWLRNKIKILESGHFLIFQVLFLLALFAIRVDTEGHFIHFNSNLFLPDINKVMLRGFDSNQILGVVIGVTKETLASFLPWRYIFFIQPPIYLFTLTSLLLFLGAMLRARNSFLRFLTGMAFFIVIFPFTSIPNIFSHIFKLNNIAYPRLMFAFFFIQAIAIAYVLHSALNGAMRDRASAVLKKWMIFGVGISGVGVIGVSVMYFVPFDGVLFSNAFSDFTHSQALDDWMQTTVIYQRLFALSCHYFLTESFLFLFYALIKYLSLALLCLTVLSARFLWKALLVTALLLELIAGWNLYVFQKHDLYYFSEARPEVQFLKSLSPSDRVATLNNAALDVFNFYDHSHGSMLRSNFPGFWGVKTIEAAALNLSPKIFRDFWRLEPENTYTPTLLNKLPSKMYDLMGLTYLFSTTPLTHHNLQLRGEGDHYYFYRYAGSLPRFYFAEKLDSVQSDQEALSRLSSGFWRPEDSVLIENDIPDFYFKKELPAVPLKREVKILSESFNRVTIETVSQRLEFLATTESFHPNWKVFVDGVRQRVTKTNFYFRGVFLSQGMHRIEFVYRPLSFFCGALLSALTVLTVFFFVFKERNKI